MFFKRTIKFLHTLATISYFFVLILPFIILLLLSAINFNVNHPLISLVTFTWSMLIFLAFMLFLNMFIGKIILEKDLKQIIKRKLLPVESLRGFTTIKENFARILKLAFLAFVLMGISYMFYFYSILLRTVPLTIVATSLALMAFGLILLMRRPRLPIVEIGALIEFFTPVEFPVYVDNLFQDTLPSILDPISLMKFDDWKDFISPHIRSLEGVDQQITLERAIEKIFLMHFLHIKFPETITEDVVLSEIAELLKDPKHIDEIKEPKRKDIFSFLDLKKFLKRLSDIAPEITTIVNRLFLTLRDNLNEFKGTDLFFDIAAPEITKGLNGISLYIFLFNNSEEYREKPRPIRVKILAPGMLPPEILIDLSLDPKGDFIIKSEVLKPYSRDGEDIVGKLSEILQIGDGIWIRLIPVDFGIKTITVLVEERGRTIVAKQCNVLIKRDIIALLRKIVGSSSILSGVATALSRMITSIPFPFIFSLS